MRVSFVRRRGAEPVFSMAWARRQSSVVIGIRSSFQAGTWTSLWHLGHTEGQVLVCDEHTLHQLTLLIPTYAHTGLVLIHARQLMTAVTMLWIRARGINASGLLTF